MKLFWKLYYWYKFGDEFPKMIERAKYVAKVVDTFTNLSIANDRDENGVLIRDWHHTTPSFRPGNKNPVENYYNEK